MKLVRFEPFGLSRDIDRLFAEFGPRSLHDDWVPRIDVVDKEGALVVRVEAPGVDHEALDITVEGDTLVITVTEIYDALRLLYARIGRPHCPRCYTPLRPLSPSAAARYLKEQVNEAGYHRKELIEGEFKRTIVLPDGVEVDEISASSKDGILTITVPKSPEVLPRKVKIAIEEGNENA